MTVSVLLWLWSWLEQKEEVLVEVAVEETHMLRMMLLPAGP